MNIRKFGTQTKHLGELKSRETHWLRGFDTAPLDTWLGVIPQILARLCSPNESLRATIHTLLSRVGKQYPQALVLPLTVATKSSVEPLVRSTQKLLDLLCEDFGELVHQSDPRDRRRK